MRLVVFSSTTIARKGTRCGLGNGIGNTAKGHGVQHDKSRGNERNSKRGNNKRKGESPLF